MRYRILYKDGNNNFFRDVESNSLADAIWELAKELCTGTLVDTMLLPSKETSIRDAIHTNLYPQWSTDFNYDQVHKD